MLGAYLNLVSLYFIKKGNFFKFIFDIFKRFCWKFEKTQNSSSNALNAYWKLNNSPYQPGEKENPFNNTYGIYHELTEFGSSSIRTFIGVNKNKFHQR